MNRLITFFLFLCVFAYGDPRDTSEAESDTHAEEHAARPDTDEAPMRRLSDEQKDVLNYFVAGKLGDPKEVLKAAGYLDTSLLKSAYENATERSLLKKEVSTRGEQYGDWALSSTAKMLKLIDETKDATQKDLMARFLTGRWFGHRGEGMFDSSSPYDQISEKNVPAMLDLLRVAANPKSTEQEITSAAGKALILPGFKPEYWTRFKERSLAFPRGDNDALMVKRLTEARNMEPWKLVKASLEGFEGQFAGEKHDGHFTFSAKAVEIMPKLVDTLLERPGVKVTVYGSNETARKMVEHHNANGEPKVRIAEGPGGHGYWLTDYQGLPVVDKKNPKAPPVLLDAFYGNNREDDQFPETQAKQQGLELKKFPLFMEGGNLLRLPGGVNVASTKLLEVNKKMYGFPEGELRQMFDRTFGKTVFVPYTDSDTGHVDMDMTPIRSKKGPALLVPEIDLPAAATTEIARKAMSLRLLNSATDPENATSVSQFAAHSGDALSELVKKKKTYDQIAAELSPYTEVVRVPTLNSRYWGSSQGSSSTANALFFIDGEGKRQLIVPDYPSAPGYARFKAEYLKKVGPLVDRVSFVSTYSDKIKTGYFGGPEGGDLPALQGVFHCIGPQCHYQAP